ncbi:hypothetical protein T492DRAFT_848170 [Pavlovales sp. CCMP2436]|nr:hypothetical protein T492DRAFT_848170 [Pavlovales sp. CCMP2436]
MDDLLGTSGKCIGKIQESFLLSSPEEMLGMLEQKGIEGLLIINKESVDFGSVSIDKIKKHVLRISSEINVSYITAEKSPPSVPNVLIFVEARFWVMCGVKFTSIAAMVSYDFIEGNWNQAFRKSCRRSYARKHHRVSPGSIYKALDFAELLDDDHQNLDKTRVKIRMVGNCGYMPNSPCGPSLCGLRVKVWKANHNNWRGGFVKTTLLAMEVTQMSMPDCVFVSPNHLFRKDAVQKGFTQTMCHARLLGETRLITEETIRNLAKYPLANIIVDESTMLTQIGRVKIVALAASMGSRLFFMGDYCDITDTPMQCLPINSASMNIENLRRVHIPGVRRTTDIGLMELQADLRHIITGSAGGIYVLGGIAENAIVAARRFAEDAVPEDRHLSIYGVCEQFKDEFIRRMYMRNCNVSGGCKF